MRVDCMNVYTEQNAMRWKSPSLNENCIKKYEKCKSAK
jgi:hypothetical protein